MYKMISEESSDVCVSGFSIFRENNGIKEIVGENNISVEGKNANIMIEVSSCAWNKLCRSDYLKYSGIRFQSLPSDNDVLFSMLVMLCTERISYIHNASDFYYRSNTKFQISNHRNPFNFLKAIDKSIYELRKRKILDKKTKEIVYSYFVFTSCSEMKSNFDKTITQEYYNYCKSILFDKDVILNNPKLGIYLEKWKNCSYESGWIKRIADYDLQLDDNEQELMSILQNEKSVYLWGKGKRACAFERFSLNHQVIINGIFDRSIVSEDYIDEYGFKVFGSINMNNCEGLFIASNHVIFEYLIDKSKGKARLLDLEKFCPL